MQINYPYDVPEHEVSAAQRVSLLAPIHVKILINTWVDTLTDKFLRGQISIQLGEELITRIITTMSTDTGEFRNTAICLLECFAALNTTKSTTSKKRNQP